MTQGADPSRETADSPGLAALIARAERAGRGAPPVDRWNPPHCGAIDLVIRRDGRWVHEGSEIRRPALVRLFASVLRKDEDGETYLVTPAERLRIRVEDAPFQAVEMERAERDGEPVLVFRTDAGDLVEAGPSNPLRFGGGDREFVPYVLVRGRLEARLTRAVGIALAELAEESADGSLVLRSHGAVFPLPDV